MRTRHFAASLAVGTLALIAWLGVLAPARAAELTSKVQQHIRASTFEVVQLKPPDGEVTYDREPPMDLIPYRQRNDKYRSIGTAFATARAISSPASTMARIGEARRSRPIESAERNA